MCIRDSYNNVPRFNSFLKELKQIWTKKYKWNFRFQAENEAHKNTTCEEELFLTENGILINEKIIYQEDIDEGKVSLPDSLYPA